MESEDKRVNQLTQVASAPANGVLVIDVPGSTETNGITVDNLARTMPEVTYEKNGIMGSSLFHLLKIRNIPYSLYRNQCAKIGRLINLGAKHNRFTLLLTGASHYGLPATYIVEFGGYHGGIYSILFSPKTSQLTDAYYGEIIIYGNEIYMCTNDYVDEFKVFVVEHNDCEFHNVAENAAKPVGGISSRDTIYSIINT